MQEPRTLKSTALEVAWSALTVTAKMAAVLFGVGIPVMLVFFPACGCNNDSRAKAYRWAMISDLRNLAAAQEIYFSDSLRYAASLPELDFTASTYITVELTPTSDSAWSASASHTQILMQCTIFIGNIEPPVPEAEEGEPSCDDPS